MTAATSLRLTADELTGMGATQAQTVTLRPGVTRVVNSVAREQNVDVAANDPKIELTPDTNDLRRAQGAANDTHLNPRMVMNRVMTAALMGKNVTSAQREQITAWLRNEKTGARFGFGSKRAFNRRQLEQGQKLALPLVSKNDVEVNLALSKVKASPAQNRLSSVFSQNARNLTNTPTQIAAQTMKSVPVANLRMQGFAQARRNGAMPNRGMYSVLSAGLRVLTPTPAQIAIEIGKKIVQAAHKVAPPSADGPDAPMFRPQPRRRRLMTPSFGM